MNIEKSIQEIPIEDIIPNRFQPRLTFNEEGLSELTESIKQHGIIQPLVVRKLGDKYEIIAGERRYKAATQAGLAKVPVIISDIDDNKSAEVALVENIQRRNLTAIEEAKSYKNLLDRGYLTQEQLANKMGVSQSAIANKLRLLNLDSEVQDALLNEKISERHARALLGLEDSNEQKKWLKRIINERMTVRQLDIELKKIKEKESANEDDSSIPLVNINPDIDTILNNAEDINSFRTPHDVTSMLMPNNMEKKEEPKIEPFKTETKNTNQVPNKFFNFLEDEEANMDIGDTEEIFNTFIPLEQNIINESVVTKPDDTILNEVEILDDLDSLDEQNIVPLNIVNENENLELNNLQENQINEEELAPFSSTFFNNSSIESESTIENNNDNNIIEEIKPINEEMIIDPMDSVIKLEPDYEEKQEEASGTDLKSQINTIRNTIESLNKKGCEIEAEEADLEDLYHITIKIKKN